MARRHGNKPKWQQRVDNPAMEDLLGEPEGNEEGLSAGQGRQGQIQEQPKEPELETPSAPPEEEGYEESGQEYAGGDDPYSEPTEEEQREEPKPENKTQKRIRELIEKNKRLEQNVNQFQGLKQEIEEWRREQLRQQQQQQERENALSADRQAKEEEVTLPTPPDYVDQEVKDYFNGLQRYITERERQYQKQVEELKGGQQQHQQYYQQQAQLQQALTKARTMEESFTKKAPDYYDALQHLRNIQMQVLTEDYQMPADQAQAQIQQDELSRLQGALNSGRDVAELTYNMSKRFGYKPKQQSKRNNPDKSKASMSMGGGSARGALRDLGEKDEDEFDAALKELFK